VFVTSVQAQADVGGVKPGDRLLAVGTHGLLALTQAEAAAVIKAAAKDASFTFQSLTAASSVGILRLLAENPAPGDSLHYRPLTIVSSVKGVEASDGPISVVVVDRSSNPRTGLLVIGGANTPLDGVFINSVKPDGAAAQTGLLKVRWLVVV
jgi:hypothetical protein